MACIQTFLVSVFLLCSVFCSAKNQNNITVYNFLRDPETLISSNGYFQLGFFNPANSSSRYLGIWYHDKNDKNDALEVVWVANRDNPLNDSSGVLRISEIDGNLQLLNAQNMIFWSIGVNLGANSSSIAKLQDNGNLVLLGDASLSGSVLWQSFDHPTDSFLPDMKIAIDKNDIDHQLRSWRSDLDPSSGRFTIGTQPDNNITAVFIWDGDQPYWRGGPWNGNNLIGVPITNSVTLDGYSLDQDSDGNLSLSFLLTNQSTLAHLVLKSNGAFIRKEWDYGNRTWKITWSSIESDCDIYGYCGSFGSCNSRNNSPICSCLKGFEPKNKLEWSKGNWTNGCVRRTPLQCVSRRGKDDGFSKLSNMKTPDDATLFTSSDEEDCGKQCLGRCQCLAYAYYPNIGCMTWNNSLIDTQEFSDSGTGVDLFIRLAYSELGKTSKKKIILPFVIITGAIVLFAMCFLWRSMSRKKGENMFKPNMISPTEFRDLPIFKFQKLVMATNNFENMNKLGRGGFGPVYKGKLEDGQEIAVKRLARASGQGLQEFMNEVVVISKLQHMNLVKLLGCCVERDEKMLVYEYMPNKSLNVLLFDPQRKGNLDWKKRFNIIEGICKGLLYLHRDSRLRIIHRDLKASNILLDENLNPKISDFGMARIFGRNEDQANTLRVVGTYGYMSPEYAMNGCFSEKSDIFSFGVLLLEIVSGISISSFNDDDECLGLIGYAWKLWNEDNILPLIDTTIFDPHFQVDILRCIQLALLCVQEFPEERPTIPVIISMLQCDIARLPSPNQPGFIQRRSFLFNEFHGSAQQNHSINQVSLTFINGR